MGGVRGVEQVRQGARRGRAALALCLVLVVTIIALSVDAAAAAKPKAKATTLATLKIQASKVTIKHDGQTKYIAAKDGQVLHQGDAIQTDASGHAEIDYTDGSLTRLSPSTIYTITQLTDKRGGRQTQGTLSVGETWNRAAKVSETGSFEVKAGGTTAAVAGTAFVFSCVKRGKHGKHKTCKVISVVDTVNVSTPSGADAQLPPGTVVVVTDDVAGSLGKLTYDDLIKLPVVVDNLNLDEKAGKGGLYEITPPAPTTTTTTTEPPTTTQPPRAPAPTTPPPPPDVTAPAITLSAPPQGAVYARNQAVAVSYACADEAGGSGLASCNASVASGGALDTSTVGVHTFTVTASDNAGNTAFVTHTYTVTG
jgi:FecR protein